MFGKAVVLVLALGACGCTLLSMRQARLQAASELVQIQLKIRQQDERLWGLRTRIGAAVTPDHVREMAAGLGPLRPIRPAGPWMGTPEGRQFVDIAPAPLNRGAPAVVPAKDRGTPGEPGRQPGRRKAPANARLAINEPPEPPER